MGLKVRTGRRSAELRAAFTIGDERVAAGTRKRVELPLARLPVGNVLSMPIEVVHGRHPGPAIWLSAAIHGDELNGVPIIRNILERLDPKVLVGTVVAVPVVNVFGLVNESRYLPDRRDLNRNFPGRRRGALASQIAKLFMTEVVSQCEFGIDYHTGSGGRTNLPQVRCDLEDEATKTAACAFGTSVILHSKLRDGSLRAAAGNLGIRCLLYEAGEAGRLDPASIATGVSGTMRVLSHLGMIRTAVRPPRLPSLCATSSRWIRSPRSGLLEMSVKLGSAVEKGQVVAKVFGMLEEDAQALLAPKAGIVIGHQATALVHRGDAVVHFVPT